jgi:hypothetical protein
LRLFKVEAGVGGDSSNVDAPVAGAFAGGLVGEALGRLENKDSGTLGSEMLGDGARDGAADFFVGIEQQDDLALEEAGLGEHLDGGEGHGDAGLHVEDAGTGDAALGDAPGHGAEGPDGPDGVEVAEQKNRGRGGGLAVRTELGAEAGFEDVSEGALAVELDAASEGLACEAAGPRRGRRRPCRWRGIPTRRGGGGAEGEPVACGGLRRAGRAWEQTKITGKASKRAPRGRGEWIKLRVRTDSTMVTEVLGVRFGGEGK